MTRQEIIDALVIGAHADIWYDAHEFGDDETDARIETTQQAMIEAARLIEDMAHELASLGEGEV